MRPIPVQAVQQLWKRSANLCQETGNRRTSAVRAGEAPSGRTGVILTHSMGSAEDSRTGDLKVAATELNKESETGYLGGRPRVVMLGRSRRAQRVPCCDDRRGGYRLRT